MRLPFGIVSAFHHAMENVLEGLEGVRVYIDDIIIRGSTLEQRNVKLRNVMHRIQSNGLKLNKSKTSLELEKLFFLEIDCQSMVLSLL